MPTGPASTADEIAESVKALIDRLADAKFTQEMARRGQDVAGVLAERADDVGDRATDAWRESRPMRRDAAKRFARAAKDASKWSDRTWRKTIRPALRDLWKRRTVALSAAGAAGAAGAEMVDTAAVRLGLRQEEERRWGTFFFGLVLGVIGGAIVAMLLAPKRGSDMRREIGERADEVRREIAARARENEWVPIFERNGVPTISGPPDAREALGDASGSVQEAAADAGQATGEVVEQAADETAETINETYDTIDRESRP